MNPEEVSASRVAGSFRDPSGHVFEIDGRIFRTVNDLAVEHFDFVRETPFYSRAIGEGRLIAAEPVADVFPASVSSHSRYVLEHPRLPYISYPYEWSFPLLKSAALFHLDFHLEALEAGVTLSDASAFNIQFIGGRPIFIDTLSLRKYRPGELWAGHKQFCEQFLNPILLRAFLGITHNSWYRGSQEGIGSSDMRRLLPLRRKLTRSVMTHVVLQDILQRSGGNKKGANLRALKEAGLPLVSFKRLLRGLRDWIVRLRPADGSDTVWRDYARTHSYKPEEAAGKERFISEFVQRAAPGHVWDIGCNTGDYAVAALEGGADYVVGFDFDQGALELAFARARDEDLRFLPLFLDVTNPPPSQGWRQSERDGLSERRNAEGIIALALIHHMCIASNVPLPEAAGWLVGLAPAGVIEFVPKEDPMVQELLKLREDVFPDYTRENFLACVQSISRIVRTTASSSSGRLLVEFAQN